MYSSFTQPKGSIVDSPVQNRAEIINRHGEELYAQGDREGALAAFERALEINPNFALAHNNLAVLHFEAGHVLKPYNCVKKAIRIGCSTPHIIFNAAEALKRYNSDDGLMWNHKRIMSFIDPLLLSFPNASWLTVGDANWGSDAHYVLSKGGKVLATDIRDALLAPAKQIGYIPDYKQENVECLSFADDEFDFVLCKEAFHHFTRPMLALYEMFRVAKRGVILIEPCDFEDMDIFRNFEPNGDYVYTLSEREITKITIPLKLPIVAFKPFNLCSIRPPDDYDEDPETRSLYLNEQKDKVTLEDSLCKSGEKSYRSLVSIIFKKTVDALVTDRLTEQGFRIVHLPICVFCENCKRMMIRDHIRNWVCQCGNSMAHKSDSAQE